MRTRKFLQLLGEVDNHRSPSILTNNVRNQFLGKTNLTHTSFTKTLNHILNKRSENDLELTLKNINQLKSSISNATSLDDLLYMQIKKNNISSLKINVNDLYYSVIYSSDVMDSKNITLSIKSDGNKYQ